MSEHLYSFPSRTSTSPPPDTSCSCNYVNHDYILLQNPRAPPTNVSNWYQPLQYLRLKLNFLRKGSRPRTEVRIQPSIHQNIPHWEYRHQHLITESKNWRSHLVGLFDYVGYCQSLLLEVFKVKQCFLEYIYHNMYQTLYNSFFSQVSESILTILMFSKLKKN